MIGTEGKSIRKAVYKNMKNKRSEGKRVKNHSKMMTAIL